MKIGIITNGSISNYDFYKEIVKAYDLIICADGGLAHAHKIGVLPDVILGDFDSAPSKMVEDYRSKGCKIITYPAIKNETDTEIALAYALDEGPESIDILAGIGSRFDHSLANVHLLKKGLERSLPCRIITENNEIMIIDQDAQIEGKRGEGVSLLPLTQSVKGVFSAGLAYPIEDGVFEMGAPYGVSNYISEDKAHIKIESGLLLVIKYRD